MSGNIQVDEVRSFINKFRNFQSQWSENRQNDFKTRFAHLRHGLSAILKVQNDYNRRFSPHFNIFEILGVQHKEVSTHSAVLAELLNPQGSHCQGHLFLKHFFNRLAGALPNGDLKNNIGNTCEKYKWLIFKELNTAFGNLDLVITSYDAEITIVVENKIWAGEQKDQLKRYGDWLSSQRSWFANQGKELRTALVYLTPFGSESNTHLGTEYCAISYKEDIYNWLYECIKVVSSQSVRELIRQYLLTIENL